MRLRCFAVPGIRTAGRRCFGFLLVAAAGIPTVTAAPAISSPPSSATVSVGQPAVFTVVAGDSAPLVYQWWRGAEPVIGATGPTYTIAAPTLADSGQVLRVTVASANGLVESAPVHLTVNPAAPLTFATWALAIPDAGRRGPLDSPAGDGVPNLLKFALGLDPGVVATPSQLPQLRRTGDSLVFRFTRDRTAAGIVVAPQTSSTLAAATWTLATGSVKIADDGRIETWEAPIAGGVPRSFVRLAVELQTSGELPPSITVPPQGLTVAAGQPAAFGVTATGGAALSYQWRRDGRPIRGANAATYVLPAALSADDGACYSVVVTNGAGVAASSEAVLTVTPATAGTVLYTRDRFQSPINPEIASRLQAIAATNGALRGNAFMKIGDSISSWDSLLGPFGTGNIEGDGHSWETNILFGSRPDLKPLVQFFRTGKVPAADAVSCLERVSLSARVGAGASWATEGDPSPLQQEYAVAQPRYAVIMYGSNDIGWWQGGPYGHVFQLTYYQLGLLAIVDECLARGMIPILTTMPPQEAYFPQVPYFAEMVRSIAQNRRIPLIDYNRGMTAIGPEFNFGMGSDGVHPRTEAYNTGAWLDAESLHYGLNLRNLLTLDALGRVKALLVDGAPAPDTVVSRLAGAGTPADPFRIPGIPFADMRDTKDSASSLFNNYAGSSVSVPGPEYVYRLVVDHPQTLRILAIDKGANAVRLHLLDAGGAPAGCLANDDAMILRPFAAGTYHLAVDSRTAAGGEFSLLVLVDDEHPTRATDLTGVIVPGAGVRVAWTASTSNEPIGRYAIFRATDTEWGPSYDTTPVAVVAGTTTSWTDGSATAPDTYRYYVLPIDVSGDPGAPSEEVVVPVP